MDPIREARESLDRSMTAVRPGDSKGQENIDWEPSLKEIFLADGTVDIHAFAQKYHRMKEKAAHNAKSLIA